MPSNVTNFCHQYSVLNAKAMLSNVTNFCDPTGSCKIFLHVWTFPPFAAFRAEKKSSYMLWWILFLLLLITSASTCLLHSHNLVQRLFLSSVQPRQPMHSPSVLTEHVSLNFAGTSLLNPVVAIFMVIKRFEVTVRITASLSHLRTAKPESNS